MGELRWRAVAASKQQLGLPVHRNKSRLPQPPQHAFKARDDLVGHPYIAPLPMMVRSHARSQEGKPAGVDQQNWGVLLQHTIRANAQFSMDARHRGDIALAAADRCRAAVGRASGFLNSGPIECRISTRMASSAGGNVGNVGNVLAV
jgi:hypothetical protein